MRARAAAEVREIEIFGYKTGKDIKDDPIEAEDTDQIDAFLN